jgi:predicted nucleic acid-binding protein
VAVELFPTAVTRPDAAFCDTSFILDLLTHEVATVAADMRDLDAVKRARSEQAATFFHNYQAAGTRFFSSPYTFQEASHVIARNVLRSRSSQTRWEDLARVHAAEFARLHSHAMNVVEDSWNRVQHYGIEFVVPDTGNYTLHGKEVNSVVVEAALLFFTTYASLNAADAFHIAMGMACGLEWFVTTDAGWKSVAEINVFCDS